MTAIPEDLLYTADHEWVRITGATARVGVTDHAQHELGDIVFVELPAPGRKIAVRESAAVIESVKSVADVYSPIGGTISARHDGLDPATINRDPYGEGWLFEITVDARGDLLTAAQYRALIGQ